MKTLLLGDFSPTDVTDPLFKEKKIDTLFTDTLSLFEGNDINMVNFECAITEPTGLIDKFGPGLHCCEEVAEVLKEVGVKYCAISNNHVFDFGKKGFYNTIRVLEKNGMTLTGYGENELDSRRDLVVEQEGERVAFVNVCEHEYSYALENRCGCRAYDPYDTIEDVHKAKSECDHVIVLYHGGKEQSLYPSPRLRKLCRAMVSFGAAAVLCQHSHCIGCYEEYKGGHILYGQGNFHFTGSWNDHPHWQSGLIVHLDRNDKVNISFDPVVVRDLGIDLAKGEEYDNIKSAFDEQCKNLHNGVWLEKWDEFCQSTKERYLGNISRAFTDNAEEADNELFCGRMHCEAHKDVIDWLCKHYWEQKDRL